MTEILILNRDLDWNQTLKLNEESINSSFKTFFEKVGEIIDKHVPLRKMTIQEEKNSKKPWIMAGILTSIKN